MKTYFRVVEWMGWGLEGGGFRGAGAQWVAVQYLILISANTFIKEKGIADYLAPCPSRPHN